MSKMILKQEISGRFVPNIIRSFLLSDKNSKTDSNMINDLKRTFQSKLEECNNSYLNISMYIDDNKKISSFRDITVVVELYDNYRNGLREK
jgi:hypothetical protein